MDGLLVKLTEERFYVETYTDDGLIIVFDPVLGIIRDKMQVTCKILGN